MVSMNKPSLATTKKNFRLVLNSPDNIATQRAGVVKWADFNGGWGGVPSEI